MGIEWFSTFGLWGRHAVFDTASAARYLHRRSDLFRAELVGRFIEVFGELGDRTDVARNGCRRVVANVEIIQHPLSECSHR